MMFGSFFLILLSFAIVVCARLLCPRVLRVVYASLDATFIDGKPGGQFRDLFAGGLLDCGVAEVLEDVGDPAGDLLHFGLAHAAGGYRGAAQADATAFHGWQWVEG